MEVQDQWIAVKSELRLAARIHKPKPTIRSLPIIILATGLGTVKEDRTSSFVNPFVKAGYACVTFDYATWGESEGQPRHLVNPSDQYRDVCAVVAWTREQTEFDSSRSVIWGSSFGGLHVTRLLAEDHTLAAGISQCPCVDAALAARMKPVTTSLRLGFWAICDLLGSYFGLDPIYIRAAAMKNEDLTGPALMEAPDVADGYANVIESAKGPLRNRVLARSALTFLFYRPAQQANRTIAPYLLVLPEYDSVAPLQAARSMAKKVKKAEVLTLPGGHFDLYEGRTSFEKNIKAQLDFLARTVPFYE